jgi:hypothetical protein
MGRQATFQEAVTVFGTTYAPPTVVIEADHASVKSRDGDNPLPAAKGGALTTRTDDNTGELTMEGGHGITDAARLDVYWDGGSRYGMTVGTVAVNQVPIDGGTGDVLPADETAITAMVPEVITLDVEGDDVIGLVVKGSDLSTVVFREAAADALAVEVLEANGVYSWRDGQSTNPLAGTTLVSILMSHQSEEEANVEVIVLHDEP